MTDGIGDVNSAEVGSGARFNGGKTQMEYIPASLIARFYNHLTLKYPNSDNNGEKWQTIKILNHLGKFEEGDDSAVQDILGNIPVDHLWDSTAKQFDFGAKKYAAWNWAKGMPWSVPIACIKRHAVCLLHGESIDPESDVHHYGAIGCNAVMLSHYLEHYPEGDDRPPSEYFRRDHGPKPEDD